MAKKSRASFAKSSRERDKRRKREEKFQSKLLRRKEAKDRRLNGDSGDADDPQGDDTAMPRDHADDDEVPPAGADTNHQ